MAIRYGIAAGNFSTIGTWSASTGGASDGAGINAGDDVVLDANSGSGLYAYDTNVSLATVDCTGFTGTLTHNFAGTMPVTGNTFKLVSGMTYMQTSSSRTVTFQSTSGTCLITSAGKTFQSAIFNGTGGTFQLQDNLTAVASSGNTLTAGTLDLNGFTITGAFVASGSTARAITFGSGTIANNSSAGSVDFSGSNITVTKGTGTISFTGNTASNRGLNVGTAITGGVPAINIGANTSGGSVTVSGTSTMENLTATAPARVRFTSFATYTFANAPSISGSSSNRFQICSSVPGGAATISVASGIVNFDNAFIEDITGAGGATFAATNSYNVAGNTGITITEPVSGGVIGVIGS